MPFYLTPEQDDFNKIPEIQVCIANSIFLESLPKVGADLKSCTGPLPFPIRFRKSEK